MHETVYSYIIIYWLLCYFLWKTVNLLLSTPVYSERVSVLSLPGPGCLLPDSRASSTGGPVQQVRGRAWIPAFLTRPQVMLRLPVYGPHFEKVGFMD